MNLQEYLDALNARSDITHAELVVQKNKETGSESTVVPWKNPDKHYAVVVAYQDVGDDAVKEHGVHLLIDNYGQSGETVKRLNHALFPKEQGTKKAPLSISREAVEQGLAARGVTHKGFSVAETLDYIDVSVQEVTAADVITPTTYRLFPKSGGGWDVFKLQQS